MTAPAGDQQQDGGKGGDGGSGGAQQQDGGKGGDGGTFTQAQLNAIVAQNRREVESKFEGFDELKSKAAELDKLTEASQSELERANTTANDFKSKFEAEQGTTKKLNTQLLRQKISATNHLDPDLWDRVTGDTAEEIEADVKKLVEKFGSTRGGGNLRQSRQLQSGASAPPDGSSQKEKAAAALRGAFNR